MMSRTARPQIGILPNRTKSAPMAKALKISDPRRTPPSTAIRIRPLATGAQSRRASMVARAPSNWRPPWLEMITPSTLWAIASSTSSGERTGTNISKWRIHDTLLNILPFNQIFIEVCSRNHEIALAQSRVGSIISIVSDILRKS